MNILKKIIREHKSMKEDFPNVSIHRESMEFIKGHAWTLSALLIAGPIFMHAFWLTVSIILSNTTNPLY